jgi:hypothetical protein
MPGIGMTERLNCALGCTCRCRDLFLERPSRLLGRRASETLTARWRHAVHLELTEPTPQRAVELHGLTESL